MKRKKLIEALLLGLSEEERVKILSAVAIYNSQGKPLPTKSKAKKKH